MLLYFGSLIMMPADRGFVCEVGHTWVAERNAIQVTSGWPGWILGW
jgi:hypothetical protein